MLSILLWLDSKRIRLCVRDDLELVRDSGVLTLTENTCTRSVFLRRSSGLPPVELPEEAAGFKAENEKSSADELSEGARASKLESDAPDGDADDEDELGGFRAFGRNATALRAASSSEPAT